MFAVAKGRVATRSERLFSVYETFTLMGISLFWVKKLVEWSHDS